MLRAYGAHMSGKPERAALADVTRVILAIALLAVISAVGDAPRADPESPPVAAHQPRS
jgi:hypothetical protein